MAQDTIDKIINIQFRYSELVEGIRLTRENIAVLNSSVSQYKNEIKALEKTIEATRKVYLDENSTNAERIKAQEALIHLSDKLRKAEENLKEAERESIAQKKTLQETERQYSKELQNNIKIETQASGSINQLRANISKLTAEYNALSGAEREGDIGKRMAANIKSQQEAITEAEASLGNYRSQVGSYEESITRALGVNTQFTKGISLMTAPLGVLLGVLGAVVGVVKLFASSIHETQSTGDTFDKEMAGWRNTWDLFKKSVAAVDFSLFIRNAAEARDAGMKLQEILDELFERSNSINLQEASLAKENAALEEASRNTNLSYEERLKAVKKYTENIEKMAKQREEAARDEAAGELENLFALTKAREYSSKEEREAAKQSFADGIKNYNLDRDKIKAANEYINAQNRTKQAYNDISASGAGAMMAAKSATAAKEKEAEAYEKFVKTVKSSDETYEQAEEQAKGILDFQRQYLLTSDKQVDRYVKAEVKAQQAGAAAFTENKRAYNLKNTLDKQYTEDVKKRTDERAKARLKELSDETAAYALSETAYRNYLQKLEDARRQFAAAAATLDEEIDAAMADADKDWADNIGRMLEQKQAEYRNRLLKAQTQGGDAGAQDEMLRIAQEQVSILRDQLQDVDTFRAAYEAMGLSGIEIDNKRLEALKALQDAQNALRNARNKAAEDEVKAQERSTQMSIQGAQQLAGALGGLAEAAGADAGVVAMLAIAQSAAAMGAALHKAFSSSATVWDGIAGAVAAIATITTIISQIKSLNSSAEGEKSKYRYAQGGLVTGPGTGTSDSIPARLSNGEAVMTARAVNDWGAMLSAMNVASGGNAIQVSNLPQRNDGMRGMERMMERALMNIPAPVVSVVDINKGQTRVKVQNNLGKLGRKKYA